jgi:phosphatidate cytidylyltransferase
MSSANTPPERNAPNAPSVKPGIGSKVGADLWPRVLSGIVMAIAAVALTVAGPLPFAGLVLAVAIVVSWEWGRIVRNTDTDRILVSHIAGVTLALALTAFDQPALGMLALLIGTILVGLLSFGMHSTFSSLGVVCAGLPGIALIWLRSDGDFGLWAVLYILISVVITDVGAYFSGRLIGGPKIWPRVSPNKTWAGLIGAIALTACVGYFFAIFCPVPASPVKLALGGVIIALVAQAGDFAESALKRHFGTKDASSLIPGHGGFMDRVDGLTTVAIAAGLYAAIHGPMAPAHAILTW